MRTLNIFDIGSCVHAGAVNKHAYIETEPIIDADGYRSCVIPCGAIAQVLSKIKSADPNSTFVFACDRNPTIKKGMYPNYKANREHKRNIEIQKEITEYILRDCGFIVLAAEGYEADDIIYSVTSEFKNAYDQINIYTADSDLYFLVDDNVSILPSHSRAKTVTKENYYDTVSSKEYVKYNTLTWVKILRGDVSDNIEPLPKEIVAKANALMFTDEEFAKLGNKDALLAMGDVLGQEYIDQVHLIYPLKVDVPTELIERGDMSRMAEWGKSMHCSAFGRSYSMPAECLGGAISELISMNLYED